MVFSLTLHEYNRLLEAQGGVCAICAQPSRRYELVPDRCHETGLIRGLLCDDCKAALGAFKANEDLLRSALAYLARNDSDAAEMGTARDLRRLRSAVRAHSGHKRARSG